MTIISYMAMDKKRVLYGVITGVIVSLCIFLFDLTPLQEMFELKTLDWRFRLLSDRRQAGRDVVIFYIDQRSLDHYARDEGISWPWPRGMYKPVIDFCRRGAARAVVFDMLFTETSSFGSEDDAEFSAAVGAAGNVFLAFFASKKEAPEKKGHELFREKCALDVTGKEQFSLTENQSVTLPVDELFRNAKGLGNVSSDPDDDGVFRRAPLLCRFQGRIYPFLSFAAGRYVLGDKPLSYDGKNLSLGPLAVPVDERGRMMIRYHGPTGTYKSYSIGDIIQSAVRLESNLQPLLDPAIVRDKVVIIGCSAPGLMDLRVNPFSSVYPGAEVHATVIDNILRGDFLRRMPKPWVYFTVILAAIIAGVIVYCVKSVLAISLLIFLMMLLFASTVVLLFLQGTWFDVVIPLVAIFSTFAVSNTVNYATEGKKKRQLKQMFSQYSSPAVVETLLKNPEKLKLGGERKELTVFFSDIAGFTTISESMAPEPLVDLLNEYLNAMSEVILSYDGTVDKYIGDAIMAVWGAPVEQSDHAVRACHAALDCRKRLLALRAVLKQRNLPDLNARIGLSSGMMLVGNMGSKQRFDYTVIGDTVNLGSRLEGANKNYGTSIMINERTRELAGDKIVVRELDLLRVKGKNKPIRVFELVAKAGEARFETIEKIRLFHQGVELYRQMRWDDALRAFQSVVTIDADDGPAHVYIDRVEEYRKNPPPEGWDGVFVLKTK